MSTTISESAAPDGAVAAPGELEPATASWWDRVRYPVVTFLKIAVGLYAISWLSIELLDRHPTYPQGPAVFRGSWLLEGWFRWDGNWYRAIVSDGYSFTPGRQSSVAFFPAYPMAVKLTSFVLRDVILSAIVVTFVCGLAVAVLFYRWCARRTSPSTARLSVLVLLLYPYAYYLFGAVYADALFIAAAIGAFVLLDRGHPVLAGVLGAVATAARPVGLGVLVGLIAVMLEQRGIIRIAVVERVRADGWRAWRRQPAGADVASSDGDGDGSEGDGTGRPGDRSNASGRARLLDRHRLRPGDLGVVLAAGGLGLWCLYLWRTWGNPLLFAETESAPGWDQAAGFHTWLKVEWFTNLGHAPQWLHDSIWRLDVRGYSPWSQFLYTVGITLQALLVLGALLLVPRVLRRFGWGYALYVLVVVGIPLLGSKDFQGTGRYMLAAFPCFLVVAEWLATRTGWRRAWFAVSVPLLVFWTSLFARGYYVA